MYKIQMLNKISNLGLDRLPRETYETAAEVGAPDGILVRSADMLAMQFKDNLLAIGRAGAGVNNIPLDQCSKQGIAVFNTPGANANAVKELAVLSLFLASRKITAGIEYGKSLKTTGKELDQTIEKNKGQFAGPEIAGKKLGLIGLGAIGAGVANCALALGMEVEGYDPFLSVEAAWTLSPHVKKARGVDRLIATSDYITLHVPQTEQTKGLINAEKISRMKKGVRIINLSRGGLVVEKDMIAALQSKHVACYVTDFASEALLKTENAICYPHLGASTPEAEDNCAIMVADQFRDFFENGNIVNSVNLPACCLEGQPGTRLTIVNRSVPNLVDQFTALLAKGKTNIREMLNKSRGDLTYNIVDIEGTASEETLGQLRRIDGVTKVRQIQKN